MARVPRGVLQIVRLLAPTIVPRVLGWSALAIGFATLLWTNPASPIALLRADVMLGQGRPYVATEIYDAVARANPIPEVRAAALERAALTWSVELGSPEEARARLERRLLQRMGDEERAELLERIGELLLLDHEHLDAARRLREAHDIAERSPQAPERLARAARAAAVGGDPDLAARLWRRLGQSHPEHLARAELGLANVALADGDVEAALQAYENAADHAFDADVAAVAALGAATCLERLGNLDEALAELDSAELPEEVLQRRAAQIRARGAIR